MEVNLLLLSQREALEEIKLGKQKCMTLMGFYVDLLR
jgi:hypothetical protein